MYNDPGIGKSANGFSGSPEMMGNVDAAANPVAAAAAAPDVAGIGAAPAAAAQPSIAGASGGVRAGAGASTPARSAFGGTQSSGGSLLSRFFHGDASGVGQNITYQGTATSPSIRTAATAAGYTTSPYTPSGFHPANFTTGSGGATKSYQQDPANPGHGTYINSFGNTLPY